MDAQNRLLWHFPRQRLEGEVIRDSGLAVAGLLNTKMGGPSVFPELPPGMESRGGWKVNEDPAERNRRSVYIFVRRNTRYPMLESLDMPDTHESCGRRNMTTTAPQALTLLNSKLTLEWAQAFAARVLKLPDRSRVSKLRLLINWHTPENRTQRNCKPHWDFWNGSVASSPRAREPFWLFPRRRRNRWIGPQPQRLWTYVTC